MRFTIILLVLLISSCNSKPSKESEESKATESQNSEDLKSNRVFFVAEGDSWNLSISEAKISFTSSEEEFKSLNIATPKVEQVADANIKSYRSALKFGDITIRIAQGICENSPRTYKADISIKNSDSTYVEFKGCGEYILDYRLNQRWELTHILGKETDVENFREQLPFIEINTKEKQFTGFGGCNQIKGEIFSEDSLIRFLNIVQTQMLCAPPNREQVVLNALQSTTGYQFLDNELVLFNPDLETLRFSKVH